MHTQHSVSMYVTASLSVKQVIDVRVGGGHEVRFCSVQSSTRSRLLRRHLQVRAPVVTLP